MTDRERRTKRRFDRASSSDTQPELDSYPWPREREGVPLETFEHFTDPHTAVKDIKCTHREIMDEWDDYESLFYNEWLNVSIEPTRLILGDYTETWARDGSRGADQRAGFGYYGYTLLRPVPRDGETVQCWSFTPTIG